MRQWEVGIWSYEDPVLIAFCMIWNTLHLQYRFYLDMSMIMICLCILWIVFLMIYLVYGPLNPIAMILMLKCNYILNFKKIGTVSFHNFMIVVPLILDLYLVLCYIVLWWLCDFPIALITYQLSLYIDFIEVYFWKIFP